MKSSSFSRPQKKICFLPRVTARPRGRDVVEQAQGGFCLQPAMQPNRPCTGNTPPTAETRHAVNSGQRSGALPACFVSGAARGETLQGFSAPVASSGNRAAQRAERGFWKRMLTIQKAAQNEYLMTHHVCHDTFSSFYVMSINFYIQKSINEMDQRLKRLFLPISVG